MRSRCMALLFDMAYCTECSSDF